MTAIHNSALLSECWHTVLLPEWFLSDKHTKWNMMVTWWYVVCVCIDCLSMQKIPKTENGVSHKRVTGPCQLQTQSPLWIQFPLVKATFKQLQHYTKFYHINKTRQMIWHLVYWQSEVNPPFNTPRLLSPLINSLTQQHLPKGVLFYYPAPGWPMNLCDLWRMKQGDITHPGSFNKSSLCSPSTLKPDSKFSELWVINSPPRGLSFSGLECWSSITVIPFDHLFHYNSKGETDTGGVLLF